MRPWGASSFEAGAWPTCPSGGGSWWPSPGSWPRTPSSRNSCQEKPEWRLVLFLFLSIVLINLSKTLASKMRHFCVREQDERKKRHCVSQLQLSRGQETDPKKTLSLSHPSFKRICSQQELRLVVSNFWTEPLKTVSVSAVQARTAIPYFLTHIQTSCLLGWTNARKSLLCSDSRPGAKLVASWIILVQCLHSCFTLLWPGPLQIRKLS